MRLECDTTALVSSENLAGPASDCASRRLFYLKRPKQPRPCSTNLSLGNLRQAHTHFCPTSHRNRPARRRHHALEATLARCSDPAHALARVRRRPPGKKRSNSRAARSLGMPSPVLPIVISTSPLTARASTRMRPPGVLYLTAFSTRFCAMIPTNVGSAFNRRCFGYPLRPSD
jgi:hypothetical protein